MKGEKVIRFLGEVLICTIGFAISDYVAEQVVHSEHFLWKLAVYMVVYVSFKTIQEWIWKQVKSRKK